MLGSLYVIKGYESGPSNLVSVNRKEKGLKPDSWGVDFNIPKLIGIDIDDVPLMKFEDIKDVILQHIYEGYIDDITEIRLGYGCFYDSAHLNQEYILAPIWVICGTMNSSPNLPFYPQNYSYRTRYGTSDFVINAQTGVWIDPNRKDKKMQTANVLRWEDVK